MDPYPCPICGKNPCECEVDETTPFGADEEEETTK